MYKVCIPPGSELEEDGICAGYKWVFFICTHVEMQQRPNHNHCLHSVLEPRQNSHDSQKLLLVKGDAIQWMGRGHDKMSTFFCTILITLSPICVVTVTFSL